MEVSLTILAPNFTRVQVGSVILFFSYETCICFVDGRGDCYRCTGPVEAENAKGKNTARWSNTTLKHLAQCPEAFANLPHAEFQGQLQAALRSE
jgi:hypothetical protein